MKRLILTILLLLLASPAHPFGAAITAVAGAGGAAAATPYCTAATTCTATNPGSCDLLCEDFESSTLCFTGYDSVCRATAGNAFAGTGDSIDFTTTAGGTFPCTNGTNAFQITVTAASHNTGARWAFASDQTATKGQFYYYIASVTLAASGHQTIFELTTGVGGVAFDINLINNSGTINLDVTSPGMTTLSGSTAISTGVWYRIGWEADQAADTLKLYINGVQEGSTATNFTTTNAMRRVYVGYGSGGGYNAASALVAQYKNIAIDADGLPGACQ